MNRKRRGLGGADSSTMRVMIMIMNPPLPSHRAPAVVFAVVCCVIAHHLLLLLPKRMRKKERRERTEHGRARPPPPALLLSFSLSRLSPWLR